MKQEMGGPKLDRIAPERKQRMLAVLGKWKDIGLADLKTGLELLASPNRPTAQVVMDTRLPEVAGVFCVYGKGIKPKAALDREDAQVLLELISRLEQAIETEVLPAVLDVAGQVLLNGHDLSHRTVADKLLGPLLKILREFDPKAGQMNLI